MKLHHIFYVLGAIFIFISVIYFTYEFIIDMPDPIKLALLIIATISTFILGELFRGGDI